MDREGDHQDSNLWPVVASSVVKSGIELAPAYPMEARQIRVVRQASSGTAARRSRASDKGLIATCRKRMIQLRHPPEL